MSTQTVYQKPELFVRCPACEDGQFQVSQIPVGPEYGPWSCDGCGAQIKVRRTSETECDVLDTGQRLERKLVVLQSEGPVRLVLERWNYAGDFPGDYSNDEYHFDEHTCPTNFLGDVVEVIDPENGEPDPHGIFAYLRSGPWHDVNSGGLGWTAEDLPPPPRL